MQEDILLSESLGRKLYSKKGIMIGTLLGGPLSGTYLIAKNYKALNQSDKVARTWLFGVLAFIVIIILAAIVEQIPQVVFVLLYAWGGQFAAQKLQGSLMDKHAVEGGDFYSNWKAAGIGLIVAAIFVVIALLGIYFIQRSAIT